MTDKLTPEQILQKLEELLHPDYYVASEWVVEEMRTFLNANTAEDEPSRYQIAREVWEGYIKKYFPSMTSDEDNVWCPGFGIYCRLQEEE